MIKLLERSVFIGTCFALAGICLTICHKIPFSSEMVLLAIKVLTVGAFAIVWSIFLSIFNEAIEDLNRSQEKESLLQTLIENDYRNIRKVAKSFSNLPPEYLAAAISNLPPDKRKIFNQSLSDFDMTL